MVTSASRDFLGKKLFRFKTVIFSGRVTKGAQKGAQLGFPTANIKLDREIESGIYAGQVEVGGKEYLAAVYVGRNRTVLESHLIDFRGDLYGQTVTVKVEKKIREDQSFESKDELLEAIQEDIKAVRDFYAKKP